MVENYQHTETGKKAENIVKSYWKKICQIEQQKQTLKSPES